MLSWPHDDVCVVLVRLHSEVYLVLVRFICEVVIVGSLHGLCLLLLWSRC